MKREAPPGRAVADEKTHAAPWDVAEPGSGIVAAATREEAIAAEEALSPVPAPTPSPAPVDPATTPGQGSPEGFEVTKYLARTYEEPRCWNLVADVFEEEFGVDPGHVRTVTESMRLASRTYGVRLFKDREGFEQVEKPQDFAIVLMRTNERTPRLHCGVYYDGSVLHAAPYGGVLFQDLGTLRSVYPLMEFWAQ